METSRIASGSHVEDKSNSASVTTLSTSILRDRKDERSSKDLLLENEDGTEYKTASASIHVNSEISNNESWETDSFYKDVVEELEDYRYSGGPDECTPKEANDLRKRLHQIGADKFVLETVTPGLFTAKKLCTAFGVCPYIFDGQPDESCYQLLGLLIARELSKRQPLPQYKSIDDAVGLLNTSKNIIVITGAGISTSLGIPDFRSKHTGFYSKLVELGYSEPEEIFNIHNFDENPTTFYTLAGDILPDLDKWSPTHQFIRLLQDKQKLLTNYTQNIDNLESCAGIKSEKLIQCHGSWATATCRKCGFSCAGGSIFDNVRKKTVPNCSKCSQNLKSLKCGHMKRKRSTNRSVPRKRRASWEDSSSDEEYDIPQPGVMKPDITFFGEQLPQKFFDKIQNEDVGLVDLVIVIGTSMKVAPVSEVPGVIPPYIPQILISRDPISHINFDINLLGDCDVIVTELCRRAGWDLQHPMVYKDRKIEAKLHENEERYYKLHYENL